MSYLPIYRCKKQQPASWLAITGILMLIVFFSLTSSGVCQNPILPFSPGEKLRYVLRWAVIPAGEATLEILPQKAVINGKDAYHFRLTAKSNSFVDLFYKVRDRIDAYTDTNVTHSVHYRKNQHEGDTRRKEQIDFNWQKTTARCRTDDKITPPIQISPGTFDPLTAFYFSRTLNLKENSVIQFPVTDGKKHIQGKARIVKRETIRVLSGTYDTYLIEPDLKHIGGVFEKSKDAKIKLWITADDRRILVKIASKVAVGHFVGELVEIENTSGNT